MTAELIPHPITNQSGYREWLSARKEELSQRMEIALNQILEAFQSEIALTHARSPKPIVATYGAGPCVIVGSAAHQFAFAAHFSHPDEVIVGWPSLLGSLEKALSNKQGKAEFPLHLRGGIRGNSVSENIVKNIEKMVQAFNELSKLLSFTIASVTRLETEEAPSESLMIDARTAAMRSYDPLVDNPEHYRRLTLEDIEFARKSFEQQAAVKVICA